MASDYVVLYGSFKVDGAMRGPGSTISLEPAEAKKMDPSGACLKLSKLAEAEEKAAKAAAAELAKAEAAMKAEAEKAAKAAAAELAKAEAAMKAEAEKAAKAAAEKAGK